jgi:hypothetical protein
MTALARINDPAAMMDVLRAIMPSTFPAVVFTSLATLCVPAFSDGCTILVEEDELDAYRIHRPIARTAAPEMRDHPGGDNRIRDRWSGQWVGDHSVQTGFEVRGSEGRIAYRGSTVHRWNSDYQPTGTDVALAQLAVDHAVTILYREQGTAHAHARPSSPEAAR